MSGGLVALVVSVWMLLGPLLLYLNHVWQVPDNRSSGYWLRCNSLRSDGGLLLSVFV